MRTLVLLLALGLSLNNIYGKDVKPEDRFFELLDKAAAELKKTDDIDQLASSQLRQYLFRLQTIGEMYTERYNELSEVRREAKRLEDEIGSYRKTREEYDFARSRGASQSRVDRLRQHRDHAREDLRNFLNRSGWLGSTRKVKEIESLLESVEWDSPAEDRAYVYKKLADRLENIDQRRWDMFRLEGGGIHDLRKAARWYKLEAEVMGDIVGTQNRTCDQGAQTPKQSQGKCLVSRCLHQEMLDLYSHFGEIKDEGEGRHAMGQELPLRYFQAANDRYQRLKRENVFHHLAQEFKSCIE